MFKFIKQIFISTLMFFVSLSSVNLLECVSMNNQECKVRTEIVNVNSNKTLFVVVTILMIPMQNCGFLMLLKM